MPRNVEFADPGTYIRYVGPALGNNRDQAFQSEGQDALRFIRLNAREGPIKVPFTFSAVTPNARSAATSFSDLVGNFDHLYQAFLGVSVGVRARLFLPVDERILKLDESSLTQTTDDDSGTLSYEDSPIDNPRAEFWIAPGKNFVPAVDVQNVLGTYQPARTIDGQVLFYCSKFTYDFVTPQSEPDVYARLANFDIPSRHISFGGRI